MHFQAQNFEQLRCWQWCQRPPTHPAPLYTSQSHKKYACVHTQKPHMHTHEPACAFLCDGARAHTLPRITTTGPPLQFGQPPPPSAAPRRRPSADCAARVVAGAGTPTPKSRQGSAPSPSCHPRFLSAFSRRNSHRRGSASPLRTWAWAMLHTDTGTRARRARARTHTRTHARTRRQRHAHARTHACTHASTHALTHT